MWSDNESKSDFLRFGYLSSSICKIIQNDRLSPTTIGLFGDWGSGKSTLLKLSKSEIEKDKGSLWVEFNGWLFEGYSDARSTLMSAILEKIKNRIEQDKSIFEKSKDLLVRLSKRVNWFSVAFGAGKYIVPTLLGMPQATLGTAAVDFVNLMKEKVKTIPDELKDLNEEQIKSFFKESKEKEDPEEIRKAIREFREDFAALVEISGIQRLVVSIDDLDRCLPDTIIETLEAIRLFLFVPKTVFVIAADERLVEYAVTKRFPRLPSDNNLDVGREYLEKMVQIPIRVPPLNSLDVHSYMNVLMAEKAFGITADFDHIVKHIASFKDDTFSKLCFDIDTLTSLCKSKVDTNLVDDFRLVNQISPMLSVGFNGSPRRTKRFLNMLSLRMDMANLRGVAINRGILAKLMLLEYLRPMFFSELAMLQAKEDGKPKAIQSTESNLKGTKLDKEATKYSNDNWLSDEWMNSWLKMEPFLTGIDLRPYFYIAHDRLGNIGHFSNRMSPLAQEVLTRLLSTEEITTRMAGDEVAKLSDADISALFEVLSEKLQALDEIDGTKEEKAIEILSEKIPKIIPQIISLYTQLSNSVVPIGAVTFLEERTKNTEFATSFEALKQKWGAQNENPSLRNAVAARSKKSSGGK